VGLSANDNQHDVQANRKGGGIFLWIFLWIPRVVARWPGLSEIALNRRREASHLIKPT